MRVRLVHVTVKRSGARALREESLESETLNIGRGTDNQLQIPGLTVSLHHARVSRQGGGFRIDVVEATSLLVNGSVRGSATIDAGDVIGIGQYEVRVLPRAPDTDLGLEVEQVATSGSESEELARRTKVGVERGVLSRRALSWTFALLILVGLLLVPILGMRTSAPTSGPDIPPVVALLTQTSWNVGRISRNHGMIADRCQACHSEAFQPVRDAACMKCHGAVGAHVPETIETGLERQRCTACHQEHRGDGGLTRFDDALCIGCHADLRAIAPGTLVGDVRGFATLHPEFRPLVLVDPAGAPRRIPLRELLTPGPVDAQQVRPDVERERSGLAFSHRKHLEPGLRSRNGPARLTCESCHAVEPDGASMRKISFAENCQSCHSLAFDDAHPVRQAPHADPTSVRDAIFEFYAARALEDADPVQVGGTMGRRRPGEAMTDRERQLAFAWASERAADASAILLGDSGACAQCHTMTGDVTTRQIAPVRLMPVQRNDRRLPSARFTHRPLEHRECESCHDAAAADSAEFVILPGIDRCRSCHGDENAAPGKVSSGCLTCHRFHVASFGPMQRTVAAAAHGEVR